MDFNELLNWLKTSVVGIIILGSLGSILSIIILKLLIKTKNIYLEQHSKYKTRRYEYGRHIGTLVGYFIGTNNTGGLIYIAAMQMITFSILLSLGLFFFIVFLLLFLNGEQVLSLGSYLFLIMSLSFIYFSLRKFSEIKTATEVFIEMAEKDLKKLKNE